MSWLYKEKPKSLYIDRFWKGTREEFYAALDVTSTVYVGNLSFSTREEQIWELFSRVGEIRRIIMGLDREKKTPCGFCFVEYIIPFFQFTTNLNDVLDPDNISNSINLQILYSQRRS
jgi:hypothetical protein